MKTSWKTTEEERAYHRAYRAKRVALGLCAACGKNKGNRKYHCKACQNKKNAKVKELQHKRLMEGKCAYCGNAPLATKWRCNICLNTYRAYCKSRLASNAQTGTIPLIPLA